MFTINLEKKIQTKHTQIDMIDSVLDELRKIGLIVSWKSHSRQTAYHKGRECSIFHSFSNQRNHMLSSTFKFNMMFTFQ